MLAQHDFNEFLSKYSKSDNSLALSGPLNVYLSEHRVLVEKVEVLLDMATQVCSAMKFLESKQIVHTDVVCFLAELLSCLAYN